MGESLLRQVLAELSPGPYHGAMDYSLRSNVAVAACSHLAIPGDRRSTETPHIAQAGGALGLSTCVSNTIKNPVLQFVVKGLLLPNSQFKSFTISNAATYFGGVFSSLNKVQK